MDNQLMMFEGHEVMIFAKEDVDFDFKGDFLILAKNVSSVLGYSRTEEVTKFCKDGQVFIVKNNQVSDSALNRNRKLNNAGEAFITNLALNRVLGKSEMQQAASFQDWLYEDVVPSVVKRGAYLTPDMVEEVLLNPDTIIKLATELKFERTARRSAEQKLIDAAPKLAYVDTILQSKGLVTTTQIAKDYGMTAPELNTLLKEQGVQYQVNGQWVLYKKYADKGYSQSYSFNFKHTNGTPDVKMNTQWTQRGRLFIHELLKELGIKANIDKEYPDAK